ncbi:FHA domain-containing protein [Actimicrobium sp. CCC2.4]|uniref:FHA domain-containing protein n=1 Tax=Actimicrobium sp. CCC2.4 TaxID=3048606 RepID=UPI002AC8A41E|nr:FHA domain-containing protein [Actimicrobium sp. CCC2.4]MEB0136101.1 FHA domain-containing protein [Actimicrobium sp. CCC2.4]WPX32141.1 FHA domain-containing protein [Actimicrobium sp. CCC2.4]
MAKIIVSRDGQLLHEMPLDQERITIGRRPQNDIVLDTRSVSASHAAIVTIRQDSFVEDLNSTNGILVNGEPVSKHYLQNHDVIRVANYDIRYFNPGVRRVAEPATSSEVDFPRTVFDVDSAIAAQRGETEIATSTNSRPAPQAVLRIRTGSGAGKEMIITKSLTTIGRPGVQVALITRRPQGFTITHVEGEGFPLVDGVSIGATAHPLVSGNVVDLSGTEVEFVVR